MRYKCVLLFGAPGSGKGTQGKIIGTIPGFFHTACGDIFRSLDLSSDMGRIFWEYSSRGQLVPVPAVAPVGLEDSAPLEQPIEEQFRAGTMTLSWDPDISRVVIEVFPLTETAEDDADAGAEAGNDPEPEEVFLVRLEAGPARAFVQRAELVIEAGRPDCPFCGSPIDPDGHLCVRANGFRRRAPA